MDTTHDPLCGLGQTCWYGGEEHSEHLDIRDAASEPYCDGCDCYCQCDLIRQVEQRVLDAAEQAVADIGFNFPFDIRDVPAYGKQVFAAIRALREEK